VKILGIEVGAYLNVTMEAMEIYIYGKVWDLIYCELYVSAGYDFASIKDSHFYIRVIVDLRGLTDVSYISLEPRMVISITLRGENFAEEIFAEFDFFFSLRREGQNGQIFVCKLRN